MLGNFCKDAKDKLGYYLLMDNFLKCTFMLMFDRSISLQMLPFQFMQNYNLFKMVESRLLKCSQVTSSSCVNWVLWMFPILAPGPTCTPWVCMITVQSKHG
jgi:hypothetical protein